MLPEQLIGDCANLHHRWWTFEGFDFVGEAADVCIGGAFGVYPLLHLNFFLFITFLFSL